MKIQINQRLYLQLAGIGVLAVGIWSRVQAKDYDSFLGSGGVTSAANIMIASGALVMVIGFVGCCGALKESKVMLVIVCIVCCFFASCLSCSFCWCC